ncbi:MAG: nucleotide exchange factor GrpE [Candidatus Paceibacterota bacterium]|jgi:molecular chaperone GrpE
MSSNIGDDEKNGEETDVQSDELEKKLEEEMKRSEEYLNNWKRAQADFVNYKRRESELFEDLIDSAKAGLIMEVMPIYDSLSIAIKHTPKEMEGSEWAKGIRQIKLQLEDLLKKKGLEEIKAIGEKFSTDVHDAVEMIESEKPEGEIVDEIQKGYRFNGKLVRAAKVKVAKKAQKK